MAVFKRPFAWLLLLLGITGIVVWTFFGDGNPPPAVATTPSSTAPASSSALSTASAAPRIPAGPADSMPAPGPTAVTAADQASLPAPDPAQLRRDLARRWLELAETRDFVGQRIAEAQRLVIESSQELFAKLALTPEQADQFAVLLTEKRVALTDAAMTLLKQGTLPDFDSDVYQAELQGQRARTDEHIKALLGEARFREFEEYFRSREEQNVFIRLDRIFGDTPDALTPVQSQALLRVLRQYPTSALRPEIIAASAAFLSPTQVQALEQARQTQIDTMRQRFYQALPPPPQPIDRGP